MNRTAAVLCSKSYLKTNLILPLRSQDFQSRSAFIQYNPEHSKCPSSAVTFKFSVEIWMETSLCEINAYKFSTRVTVANVQVPEQGSVCHWIGLLDCYILLIKATNLQTQEDNGGNRLQCFSRHYNMDLSPANA